MVEIILLVVGVVAHWAKKMMEVRQETGEAFTPLDYLRMQPYRIVWTTLLAVGAGIALYSMGELTPILALATGFCADSAAGMLKRRAA